MVSSVRRRQKNIDSSSKSNPLSRRRKKYDASTWRRRRRRRKKSTNFQQKLLRFADLLTAITHTKILVAYFIISDKKNWSISGALRQQGLLIISLESYFCFWATVCKTVRPICYQTVVCLSCSVCNVGVLWLNGSNKLGMEVGLGPGHIVLDGDPAPPHQKGKQPPIFGPWLLWLYGWMD